jgi:hypothetical protein
MPIFTRRPLAASPLSRRAPSCRGGASSMLRLAQPAATRASGLGGPDVAAWLSRAAQVLAPSVGVAVRPSEFAPSQWLAGH